MYDYLCFLVQMTKDIFSNGHRVLSLAKFDYRLGTKGLFLGQLWKLLNPIIQIGAYWFVFGVGIRNGRPIDNFPYVVWLTCGLTPWIIMNQGIGDGALSIYSKASALTRANIPTCLIPVSSSWTVLMDNVWTILIMIVIFLGNGCKLSIYAFGLIYYSLCMLVFLATLNLVTSVLVMLARDFLNLIRAVLRILFFLSPIFWNPGHGLPAVYHVFELCNPFAYIITGFRDSLLYQIPFWEKTREMMIFWVLTLGFYLFGALCQSKLRKNLLDFL